MSLIQKNIQLQSFPNTDCLNAIKHGNGRDWWVISRPYGYPPGTPNFEFRQYLITPAGIVDSIVQTIGSGNSTGLGKLTFSPNGNKLVFNNYKGLIEIYDYDRCTGTISNPVTIHPENGGSGPSIHFSGCEFSSNSDLLYITTTDDVSYLFQFDLNAANIWSSIDTIWTTNFPVEAIGGLKRGPNGKIYQSGPYTSPFFYNYPYPDSVYNMYNMNLGVINSPDSLGAACDFQPYSFYLGGKRTYWGLPNNPDYELPALAGSPCDTIVGLAAPPTAIPPPELFVYYQPQWQTAFINAQKLSGHNYRLQVYDTRGKEVFSESGKLNPPYFTKNLNCASFTKGMYIVVFETEKKKMTQKFVIE
ncbi:MAG TPA: T9SS type A sorting domain-containing protein [Bacteroidia bacterium]|nr:T9SS type A sorting domain-containing protein [Bacteroidia bacterium]